MHDYTVIRAGEPGVRYPLNAERRADRLVDADQAKAFLGLDTPTFEENAVRRDQLPRVGNSFAYHDLVAMALDRDLPRSVPTLALRMMMRFADQSREALVATVRWEFRMPLGESEIEGGGELVLRDPTVAHMELHGSFLRSSSGDGWLMPRKSGTVIEGTMDTEGKQSGLINPAASALFDEILGIFRSDLVRFQWVSDFGRAEWERTWESGRADCVVLARTANRMLLKRGLTTRFQWGRILGMLDARHVWTEILDDDGAWKRFDPLLQLNSERLWGQGDIRGTFFKGGAANAMPGWPGESSMLVRRDGGAEHDLFPAFTARRVDA
ncbi:transglutaminase-like domain-containing protein [Leucobacter sp. M11]|uniref:transglutaminase-like domain-containing protein n=1 Tax=Leucobacter sp. M11 TaxID=2993565 RepID=UPI002D8062B6|nr:transglutaminase-like domain-containing protein [Leucobacter sp. M11]MEB4613735.1 transglutaminase-like domain-containing protein [Leucobacter sp. M11]